MLLVFLSHFWKKNFLRDEYLILSDTFGADKNE